MNNELNNYISGQVSQGQSLANIKHALLSNGWQEHDVDEAINTLYPQAGNNPVGNNPVKKNYKKLLLIILIILLILAGSGAAYFVYQKNKSRINNNKTGSNAQSLNTSAWKTYTNQKYKYSFKYPPNWEVEDVYPSMIRLQEIGKKDLTVNLNNSSNQKVDVPAAFDLVISAYDNADSKSIDKYIQNITNDPTVPEMTSKTSTLMVDNKKATKVIAYFNKTEFSTTVLLLSGSKMYDFSTMNIDSNVATVASDAATIQANKDNPYFKNTQIVDQIISSFHLTN